MKLSISRTAARDDAGIPSLDGTPMLSEISRWIGLLTTVLSAFYYLKIIKTIYFDDGLITFDPTKNRTAQVSVLASCIILITFFLYPSVLNNLVNTLFIS